MCSHNGTHDIERNLRAAGDESYVVLCLVLSSVCHFQHSPSFHFFFSLLKTEEVTPVRGFCSIICNVSIKFIGMLYVAVFS